ncbi:hypothetical protein BX616_006243, partial [Lobosporangium transversale]
DKIARIIIFASAGIQLLIALLGLLSAATKSVIITRVFSILWWCLTLVVLGLSIGNLILVTRNDRESIENACRDNLRSSDNGLGKVTDPDDELVNKCYRMVVIISAVVLAIQFVLMCLIGWIFQRYLREVKQDAAVAAALKSVDD